MHEHQPNLRIAASRAFRESLDQLQNILEPEHQSAESDSHIWEEAGADLDAFFGDEEVPQTELWDEKTTEES